jgi:Neuraminidase-like domain/Salmonella virulence plasmid 28.1kDa A protein
MSVIEQEPGDTAGSVGDGESGEGASIVVSGYAYTVTGTVSSSALPPIPGLVVDLLDNNVGAQPTTLASTLTGADGSYAFEVVISRGYLQEHRKTAPDLQVQVAAASDGSVVASSIIRYHAATTEQLNVTLPATAAGLPSEYELLTANLAAVYSGDLAALQENQSRHDITYLANTTGWDARAVAFAAQAAQLASLTPTDPPRSPPAPASPGQPDDPSLVAPQQPAGDGEGTAPAAPPAMSTKPPTVAAPLLYALLRAGVGADPDVLFGTDIATVKTTWTQAISQNIIPAALTSSIDSASGSFIQIAASRALNAPLVAGTSTLGELLQTTPLSTAEQQQFATLLSTYRDDPTILWQQAQNAFGAQTAAALQLDGKLAYLTINNAALIAALNQAAPLTSTLDLVSRGYYQASAWQPLLANVTPPPQTTGSTSDEQKAAYAELLAAQVRLAYPTATVAQLVTTTGLGITDPKQQSAVADFLSTNQAAFDIGAEPVGQFLARTNTTLDATSTAHVERIQRVRQITPNITALTALTGAGMDSALAVVRMGPGQFSGKFNTTLGAEVTDAIYARAVAIAGTTLQVTLGYLQARQAPLFPDPQRALIDPGAGLQPTPTSGDVALAATQTPTAPQATLADLFGDLDYPTCDDCLSVTSPAAYLVSLLDFIDNGNESDPSNPLVVLRARRPDIFALQLTCDNTNTALPYIDLVNETLAYYVTNSESMTHYAGYNDDGTVSSDQLIASPQNDDNTTAQQAWQLLKTNAWYPPPALPFDRDLALLRAYMGSLSTSLHTVMRVMRPTENLNAAAASGSYGWHDILIERLGLSPAEYQLLTDSVTVNLQQLFGYPAATDVITTISVLQELSYRTGVSYDDIVALLSTRFINPAYPLIAPLQALDVTVTTLQQLHAGTITASQFTSMVTTANPNIDATAYGGTSPTDTAALATWVLANYTALMSLLVINVVSPAGGPTNVSDTTQMFLQHLDGTPLQDIDLYRLERFIRLWQKLGLSITATDDLISALYEPTDPTTDPATLQLDSGMQTVLHRAGLAYEAIDLAGLDPATDLDSLLTCWGPVGTNGSDSLYAQLFLNPTVGSQTAVFELDSTGQIINPPPSLTTTTTVVSAKAALCAAVNLTSAEFDLLTGTGTTSAPMPGLGLGYSSTTPLSLDVVSALYRYAWLARTLSLSVLELLALRAATGIDPFQTPTLSPTVSAPLLDFLRLTQNLTAAGLAPVQALYLLWDIDLSGVSAPPAQTTGNLAIALRSAFEAVDAQFAITRNLSTASAQALMTLVLGAGAADTYFGLLTGTFTTTVGFSYPAGALPAAVLTASTDPTTTNPRLSYNDLTKQLSYQGWLDPATKAALLTATGSDTTLQSGIDSLAAANQVSVDAFFATYDTPAPGVPPLGLKTLFIAYEAALGQHQDPSGALTTLLMALVPALAGRRKEQQALSVTTGAAGVDRSFGPALLLDPALIPAADGTDPAVADLVALGQGGLTAQFWLTNNRSQTPDSTTPVAASLTYNSSAAATPPNPLPLPKSGASAIAASWSGYINASQTGDYGLAVQIDAGATVSATVNGVNIAMASTPDPANPAGLLWTNQDAFTLTNGTAIPVTITGDGLTDTFEVTWQTSGTGWQPIPADALYADALIDNLQATNLRFLKVTALASDLGLAAPDIVYLAARPELAIGGISWTAALPVTGPAAVATQSAWTTVLDALLTYAALKSQYSPSSTNLLTALTDIAAANPNGIAELSNATGWDTNSLSALATQLFQITNPDQWSVTMPQLDRVREAFTVVTGCSLPAATLITAAATTPAEDVVQAFEAAVRSRYDQAGWLDTATTINNQIRVQQRDALVAYILNTSGEAILTALGIEPTPNRLPTANDLYNYFLMDVEMSTCMQTSRIRMALSSVQQFIQRCLDNLEAGIDPTNIDPHGQWTIRKAYRVWQAAMEVFLTPQDWMQESLRDDKSEIFTAAIGQLQQGDIDADTAETIFQNYLDDLAGIAQLDPCGLYYQPAGQNGAGEEAHVIARTTGANATYYYRYYQNGSWSPWANTNLPIDDKPLQIFKWNNRLFVFWLKIQHQPTVGMSGIAGNLTNAGQGATNDLAGLIKTMGTAAGNSAQTQPALILYYSEYRNGSWQQPKTSDPNQPLPFPPLSGTVDTFDHSALDLRLWTSTDPGDAALYVQVALQTDSTYPSFFIGPFYRPFYGFVLNNTNSLPINLVFDSSQSAQNFSQWSGHLFNLEFPFVSWRWPDTDTPTALQFNVLALPSPSTATAAVSAGEGSSGETGPIITGQFPIIVRQAQSGVTDQAVMPFFAADPNNTFYVTVSKAARSWTGFEGYGLGTQANQLTTAASINIAPLLVSPAPQSDGTRDLTDQLSNPTRAAAALAAAPTLRAVLGTPATVTFNGATISATGSIPPSASTT